MLVAKAQCGALPNLLLNFKATLLRVGILHMGIHGREVDQRHKGDDSAERIREDRRSGLRWGKTDGDLAKIVKVSCIPCRQNRIRERAQRHSVVKEPKTTANYGVP